MSFANTLRLILHRKVTKRGESLIEREMCPTYYPDTGFVEIAEKVAQEVTRLGGRILTGREVIGLTGLRNGRTRVVYRCEGGQEEIEADHVISTIPLPLLVKMIEPAVPLEVLVSADALEYRPLVVLGMLTQKQNILGCGYLYLLDRPYNRIFEMNEFSVQASPRGSNILAVEIPCLRDGEMWRAPKEEIFSMCIASLSEDGFIGPGDVQKLFLVKAAYAYPIYRKGYAVHLERVLEHLKTYHSLSTVGRCGEFMYMDIDECMKRAFEHVDKIADSRYSPVVPA